MSFNQELTKQRALLTTPRVLGLLAFLAAAVLLVGCQSAPEEQSQAYQPSTVSTGAADSSADVADDMTATEAAIAAMNEMQPAEAPQQTAQLLRPDAPMNYTVKRGDTLWDIAAVFLKDPWFWPEIWQINPQVENPHLIYPGDVLSLAYGGNGDAHVSISQYGAARLQPRLRSEQLDGPIDTLPFSAIAAFLSKPSVMTEEEILAAPHILAFRDQHMIGGTGHEAYVEKLDARLNQRYLVMHVGEPIVDFETNDLVGYQTDYVATAVVNNPGKITKTVLTEAAREALRGDRLIEQQGETPLTFTPHAPKTAVDGHIIALANEATEVGQYQIVVLNRGSKHGLSPGAVLAVDQRGEVVNDVWSKRPFGKEPFGKAVELPYERSGTLIVFKVFNRVSYALVIGARAPMQVADRVYNP
ncbi:MAG TPA: LysM peptidoglycan-binding domain-containing protein [Steroidobacteraceae bacterium]|nr:LysM peptidoglycan-binding domain-containing protein [Steroidobacteraceae bacterium]